MGGWWIAVGDWREAEGGSVIDGKAHVVLFACWCAFALGAVVAVVAMVILS